MAHRNAREQAGLDWCLAQMGWPKAELLADIRRDLETSTNPAKGMGANPEFGCEYGSTQSVEILSVANSPLAQSKI
jgi:hypothetical protein